MNPRSASDLRLVALGFASAAGQALLFREMAVAFDGNELVASALLSAWLLLTGAGAVAGALAASRAALLAEWGPAALGPGLAAALLLARAARPLLSPMSGVSPSFPAMALASFAVLAPFCLLSGALFPAALRAGDTRTSAPRGYALEAAGFLAGGLSASFLLVPLASNWAGTFLVAAVAAMAGGVAAGGWRARAVSAAAAAVSLVLALQPEGARLDAATRAWRFPGEKLVRSADLLHGTLSATVLPSGAGGDPAPGTGHFLFRENGAWSGDSAPSRPDVEEFVHLALLAHPAPRRVLLLGGGIAGELAVALRHPVRADVVIPERRAAEVLRPFLAAPDREALSDPRVRILEGDGRLFLRRAARGAEKYDVVLAAVPDPSTGSLNRFYTEEFFRETGRVLERGGVAALRLSAAPGHRGVVRERLIASVSSALSRAFPHVRAVEADHAGLILLGSPGGLELDAEALARRFEAMGAKTVHVNRGWLHSVLDRKPSPVASAPESAPANRDLRPVSYRLAFALWMSRFGTRGALEIAAVAALPLLLLAGAAAASLRKEGGARRAGLVLGVAAAGLAGMGAEVGLLFAFQAVAGAVWTYLGALAAAFMAGSAAGAWIGARASSPRLWAPALGAGFAGLGALSFFLLRPLCASGSLPLALAAFMALQACAGFLTGALFPQALRLFGEGEGARGAGVLYGADLAGAAGGAVLAGALAVPLLGIPAVMLLAGAAALAGGAALFVSAGGTRTVGSGPQAVDRRP